MFVSDVKVTFNLQVTSTTMKLLPLVRLCLLTWSSITSADQHGPVVVVEGSDVILPCSLSTKENIESKLFDWKKDGLEVFMYDGGIHYNNGRTGQDKQFRGRVSHFQDELKHGNASIKITNTKVADSGNYTCIFPRLQPERKFHIKLNVGGILKDRSEENIPGAAPKPIIMTLDQSKDWALLQCDVHGAPQPKVEWWDSAGNILPAEEPHVSERGGSFYVTLNTTVTKTDRYRCVATQETIKHQIYTETYVRLNGAAPKPYIRTLGQTEDGMLLQCEVQGASPKPQLQWQDSAGNILPAEEPQVSERGGSYDVILQTTVTKTDNYRCVATQEEIKHQTHAEIYVPVNEVITVEEKSDVILPCSLSTSENIESKLFDWKKDGQKRVFYHDSGIHSKNSPSGQDVQFTGRVSHFPDELKHGNASIIIRNTKVADSGDYTCDFPLLQPERKVHIQLVVGGILKDRSEENTPGAAPKPYVTILDETKVWVLLQCEVRGASPKPQLQWQDSAGNILPAKEPQVSKRGGSYDVILQTNVTKTDRYHCVATQEDIKHQTDAEIHVVINESSTGLVVGAAVLGALFVCCVLAVLVFMGRIKLNCKKDSSQDKSDQTAGQELNSQVNQPLNETA